MTRNLFGDILWFWLLNIWIIFFLFFYFFYFHKELLNEEKKKKAVISNLKPYSE